MKHKKLYLLLVCTGSIAVLTGCILFLLLPYESLIWLALSVSGKPYLESVLRQKVFTTGKYALLRVICFMLLAMVPLLALLLLRYKMIVTNYTRFLTDSTKQAWAGIKHVFLQNKKAQNVAVAVVMLAAAARSLYYITQYPLQYDELWSYNYFTAQPFYYSLFVSSNYPLYEVSTGLFKYLPFSMPVNMRLPVLIAGLLACIILYACLKKYFQHHLIAIGGMALFAFMPATTFYMLYARGVMYDMVFAIMAFFAVLFWIENKKALHYLVVYGLATAASMYAMPTHLYLWAILFLAMLISCYKTLKNYWKYLIAANAGAGLLSLLLYAPILAGSGISFLLTAASDTVSPRPAVNDLFLYNADISRFFTGYNTGLFILVSIAFVLLLLTKKFTHYRLLFLCCWSLYLLPSFIYFVQNVQVPARALAFTGLLVPLLFSAILASLTGTVLRLVLAAGIIVTAGSAAFISHQHHYLNWSIELDKHTKQLASVLMQHHITTCYDNSSGSGFFYYYPALEYYYRMNGQTFQLYTADKSSLRYKPLPVGDEYDCLVYPSGEKVNRDSFIVLFSDEVSSFKVLAHKK